ncbi:amino acid ABC transporter substrate-binding protein [Pseudoalteromonas sp. S3776]|nr:amino acid ABC transporter substrate-binding protein [Pseudoalteromonas sp. S3776]
MRLLLLCFISYFFISPPVPAAQKKQPVVIAASATIPPYVIEKTDTGIQLNIIKAALIDQGLDNIVVIYMSNKRAEQQLHSGKVDILLNYAGKRDSGTYPSQPVLSYKNVAVSLKKRDFAIESVNDLNNKSVLGFQHATAYLPPSFAKGVAQFASYEEVVNQRAQIDRLMKEWVDVIVLDERIFHYYNINYSHSLPVNIHAIFPKAPRPAYFNNPLLQQKFDKGLVAIKQSGKYQQLLNVNGHAK